MTIQTSTLQSNVPLSTGNSLLRNTLCWSTIYEPRDFESGIMLIWRVWNVAFEFKIVCFYNRIAENRVFSQNRVGI
jgi:hypothetical protein